MTKKTKTIILVIVIVLIVGVLLIIQSPREPEAFLTDKQVIKRINSFFPEAEPKVIQDVLYLDDTHVFVPFINESKEYRMSFWVWKDNKWRAASVDNGGEPKAWNGKKDSFFMWNLDPKDEMSEIKMFMIKDRSFIVSEDEATYEPGLEMMHSIMVEDKSYGVEKYPDSWLTLMDQYTEVQKESIFDGYFEDRQTFKIGNRFYGKDGKAVFPTVPTDGIGYGTGNDYLDVPFLLYLEESELEGSY
ncbi:hypothetical protein ACQKL5_16520 [Peribacillus sp. NPDC097675]|uniref:hypothetical protein n=1 Tax=Peribacillus sp. NPDC097675 TaxID=3390618 RepID=UPI003D0168AB